jgi:glutaconate CoA-transferase subunit B
MVPKVDFISAPGVSKAGVYRVGGPYALVTGLALFLFDRTQRRFRLDSVHPGHTVEEVRDHTGFEFDCPAHVASTRSPDACVLAAIRGRIRDDIALTYPQFAAHLSAS